MNNQNNIFLSDDFDFNGYNYQQLDLICSHNLPIRSHYPKLVVIIYLNGQFQKWIHQFGYTKNHEKELINILINSIKLETNNISGNLINTKINLSEGNLWKRIVDFFINSKEFSNNINKHQIDVNKQKIGKVPLQSNSLSPRNSRININNSRKKKNRHIILT